jgi:hypothetical protein
VLEEIYFAMLGWFGWFYFSRSLKMVLDWVCSVNDFVDEKYIEI